MSALQFRSALAVCEKLVRSTLVLPFVCLLGAVTVHAGENQAELITAPGHAVMEVSPDRLFIDFELLTERSTFTGSLRGPCESSLTYSTER